MPPGVVIGTMTAGADGPPTATIMGSPTVMFEGRAACTIGHAVAPHIRYGSEDPHGRIIATGAPNVLIMGKAAAFAGCATSCGDTLTPGVATVLIGP